MKFNIFFLTCYSFIFSVLSVFDIMHFGAVPHSDNVKDHFQNQKAIMNAIKAASQSSIDRVVRIPAKTFYSMPIRIDNIDNLKIQIFGRLAASKNVKFWPRDQSKRHANFIQINNSTNLEISGGGKIDGRGYHWWMLCILVDKKYMTNLSDRPHLINMQYCNHVKVHDLKLKNSAQFHLKLDHCHDFEIFNMDIKVNTTAQLNLLKKSSLQGLIWLFPLNTDGIDPSGGRMHIYNISVQNFDDVVVPKPSHDDDCTQDMLIQNAEVRLGVGMSIGSVPPHEGGSCIRNITFRNVYMKRPFKGIYIKSNPGVKGWGNVTNIYYKNFTMDRPIWWAIYLGPQQMLQPDRTGPGCMLYPFDPKGTCSTQPLITFKNITLDDIRIHKSLLYPITLRCNVSNPCKEINFINVHADEWKIGQKQKGYVCEFASGKSFNTTPKIDCLNDTNQSFNIQKEDPISETFDSPFFAKYLQNFKQFFHFSDSELSKYSPSQILKTLRQIQFQIEQAVQEIGYEDDEDDEFTYDIKQIDSQLNEIESLKDYNTEQMYSRFFDE